MKKKFLSMLFVSIFLFGCNNTPGDSSGKSNIDSSAGNSSSSTQQQSGSEKQGNEYDSWCNSWSQPGHLYFHYNRGDKNDYDNFCLWVWQFAPQSLEGSLWAYSGDPKVSANLTLKPMSTQWMTAAQVGAEGTGDYFKDKYGVIVDVDLYKSGLIGGKTGKTTTFEGAEEIGFLFVKQDSMDGSANWTSDGGRETYIDDFAIESNWRSVAGGKCMHVFVSSGAFNDYSFYQGDGIPDVRVNPINEDHTGQYRSLTTAVDTKYNNTVSKTSASSKDLGVGYQVFVASFRDSNGDGMGDIRGIIDSLDYFDDLGVDVLWLTPIQQSDSYHGYDISDYYAVDKKFGTIDDYRELIFKAHQKGIKVLMDLVLNHTSKNNIWFEKSQWGVNSNVAGTEKDNTGINWRDIYTWKYKEDSIRVSEYNYDSASDSYTFTGNKVTKTVEEDALSKGPSWYRDGESDYYYYGKFGSGMPEINYDNQQARELVVNMAKYWLSFGLDGFRLDAVKHIYMEDESSTSSGDVIIKDVGDKKSYDDEKGLYIRKPYDYSSNLTKNVNWWKYFSNELKTVYPNCYLVGENFDGWGTRTAPYYQALDSQFNFSAYYHIPSWLYNGGTAGMWASSQASETFDVFGGSGSYQLGETSVYVEGGKRSDFIDSAFTSNHDVMRAINQANGSGTILTTTAKEKITGTAEELGKAQVAAAVTLLNPGISWIYYGDELGMSSNTDTHMDKYGNENCMDIWYRQPFLWEDQSVRSNYKNGQYTFELDSYNTTLSNNHMGIKYTQASAGGGYTVASDNPMYSFYKAMTDIKHQYPRGAKVDYTGSSDNVLVLNVTGSGKALKIYICLGLNNGEYLLNPGSGYSVYKTVNCDGITAGSNFNKAYSVVAFKQI